MLIPLGFFLFVFLNITTLVLIQLYLGTGILVETIVVVDILVGFFLSIVTTLLLMRLLNL